MQLLGLSKLSWTNLDGSGQPCNRGTLLESFRQLCLIVGCALPALESLLGSSNVLLQRSIAALRCLHCLLHSCCILCSAVLQQSLKRGLQPSFGL